MEKVNDAMCCRASIISSSYFSFYNDDDDCSSFRRCWSDYPIIYERYGTVLYGIKELQVLLCLILLLRAGC